MKEKGIHGNLKLESVLWLFPVPIILIINVPGITNPTFIRYLHHIICKPIFSNSH